MVTFAIRLVNQPICGREVRLKGGMPGFIVRGQFGIVIANGFCALRIRELDGREKEKFSKTVSFRIELPTDYVLCCACVGGGQGKGKHP